MKQLLDSMLPSDSFRSIYSIIDSSPTIKQYTWRTNVHKDLAFSYVLHFFCHNNFPSIDIEYYVHRKHVCDCCPLTISRLDDQGLYHRMCAYLSVVTSKDIFSISSSPVTNDESALQYGQCQRFLNLCSNVPQQWVHFIEMKADIILLYLQDSSD